MFLFITSLVLFAIAVVIVIWGLKGPFRFLVPALAASATVVLGLILLFFATFWTNGQGEAKVQVNSLDRSFSETIISGPASGFRAPWIDFIEFDLSNQELTYGGKDTPPSYMGGTVSGREITISVGGINGGSTQGYLDATFVYNQDPNSVLDIYKQYPYSDAQARFTKAIIEKQVLSSTRQVPSKYSAVNFRGPDRPDAEQAILDSLNDRLGDRGVTFTSSTIQDVRYPDSVEDALKAVEVANQKQQEAEANLRATEVSAQAQVVEAKAKAEAAIAEAEGQAEANRKLAASLTPQVLQKMMIDAYGEGTVYVVPQGSTPLITTK
jgi:hypothetical protein